MEIIKWISEFSFHMASTLDIWRDDVIVATLVNILHDI